MRALTKSVILITIFAVLTRGIGFIFRVILSRILSPEMLGIYQTAMSVFMVLLTVIASGIPFVISRAVANKPKDQQTLIKTGFITSLVVAVSLCVLVFLCAPLLKFVFANEACAPILFALLPAIVLSSVYTVLRAVWWGERRFVLLGTTELIEQVARVLLFIAFLGLFSGILSDVSITAWSFTAANVVSAAVVAILFLKLNKLSREKFSPQKSDYKNLIKSALPITGVRLITSATFPLISILLPFRLIAIGYSSAEALALFGVFAGMAMPLLSVPATVVSALATALVPDLSNGFENNKREFLFRQTLSSLKFSIFINFLFVPIFIAMGNGLGLFLFDNAAAGGFIRAGAITVVFMGIAQISSTVLNSLKQEKRASINFLFGSIALFFCVWFLPRFVGGYCIIIGMLMSAVITSILNIKSIEKLYGRKFFRDILGHFLKLTTICCVLIILGQNLFFVLLNFLPLFWTLGFSGITLLGLFYWLCRVYKLVK